MCNYRILRPSQMCKKLSISKATLYRLIKMGEFPPPLQLGGGSVGWPETVGDEWIQNRPTTRECGRIEKYKDSGKK